MINYEAFSEKVGVFRRNLYKFVDIFGELSETFGDGSDQSSLFEIDGGGLIVPPIIGTHVPLVKK